MPETGKEMLDEAIEDPSLDRFLDRHYLLNTPTDYVALVTALQKKRLFNINNKEEKNED
jgi:hypothetical protein